ncbi:hypothetical protein ANN_01926 [Periplaneta americana]|uniref:Uncharacterized protein n=1 Tax=Periplaneta americana TaxID=6978 RepID=A0ABQ8TYA9_PERAM|nr:hypothetical protein ANN_01926 [Periplaneta americana]
MDARRLKPLPTSKFSVTEVYSSEMPDTIISIDIIAYSQTTKKGYIIDPTIRIETGSSQPEDANQEKINIYLLTVDYFKTKYQLEDIEVIGLLIGARVKYYYAIPFGKLRSIKEAAMMTGLQIERHTEWMNNANTKLASSVAEERGSCPDARGRKINAPDKICFGIGDKDREQCESKSLGEQSCEGAVRVKQMNTIKKNAAKLALREAVVANTAFDLPWLTSFEVMFFIGRELLQKVLTEHFICCKKYRNKSFDTRFEVKWFPFRMGVAPALENINNNIKTVVELSEFTSVDFVAVVADNYNNSEKRNIFMKKNRYFIRYIESKFRYRYIETKISVFRKNRYIIPISSKDVLIYQSTDIVSDSDITV